MEETGSAVPIILTDEGTIVVFVFTSFLSVVAHLVPQLTTCVQAQG